MDYIFLTGLTGSIVLVAGAAWPEKKAVGVGHSVRLATPAKHTMPAKTAPLAKPVPPAKSIKNWLLAVGGLIMMLYAALGYLAGGSVFFVFLQALIIIASILMMLNLDDRIDIAVISICSLVLIVWSVKLFEGYGTLLFIAGLASVGMGYAFSGTLKRNFALASGSILIATFSYLQSNWIFFWVNVFFALFSVYYLSSELLSKKRKK